jgi:hypothetical protein
MKDYSGRVTEASERLRAQPAILHYKAQTGGIIASPHAADQVLSVSWSYLPEKVGKWSRASC